MNNKEFLELRERCPELIYENPGTLRGCHLHQQFPKFKKELNCNLEMCPLIDEKKYKELESLWEQRIKFLEIGN
jgi:hypothetical protein